MQVVTRLDPARWKPAVYCLGNPGRLVSELEAAEIPVTCFHARGLRDILVVRRLAKALRTQKPELLQTFLFHANLLGRLAGWWAGVPHIVSGIRVAEKRTKTHLWCDRLTNWLVDRNVCVSNAVAQFSTSEGGLKPSKTIVIPNGVDYERFANAQPAVLSEFGIPEGSRVIVSVGRLAPQKGLVYLLNALPELLQNYEDIHQLFVGDGPQREALRSLATELGIADRVHFAGWRADVPALLKACDCLALPSLWEGMPNVVLEAMASGIPVVATRVEGVEEQITSGENGFIVAPKSRNALVEGIDQVFRDQTRISNIIKSAQQTTMNDFTWNSIASKYEELFQHILRNEPLA